MAHEVTAGNSRRTVGERTTRDDVEPVEPSPSHGVPSHLGERFGAGLSAAVFLGTAVGIAATWALGGSTLLPFFVALGLGFVLSPGVGVLAAELSE